MIRMTLVACLAFVGLCSIVPLHASEPPAMVIHEWGTFTSMQDEFGNSLGGVNNEEEELPQFVHTLGHLVQQQSRTNFGTSKGMNRCRPDVSMRLETPVIYFHMPPGVKESRVDVSVKFNGGYLTQFFPIATSIPTDAKGLNEIITSKTQGALTWKNLLIGTNVEPPKTPSAIWNAPRKVEAASVLAQPATITSNVYDNAIQKVVPQTISQSDKYLFYRGVGHLDAPLRVFRNNDQLSFAPQAELVKTTLKTNQIPKAIWLVDIAETGKIAWRKQVLKMPENALEENEQPAVMGTVSALFSATDYKDEATREGAQGGLKQDLKTALMQDGMFDDEAQALLNTWDESYFKSPGLRVFFMVPQAWTDKVLPLDIRSELPQAPIKRAMVGRIELITPAQRELAAQIIQFGPYSQKGRQCYLQLGRFRNVILMDVKNKLDSMVHNN
ncbi:MAG: hypothetical protein WCT04_14245 [Planctomycetota bacterium]